jgi:hypothetical protein
MIVLVYIASQPQCRIPLSPNECCCHELQQNKECATLGIYLCFLDQKLKFELEHPVELEFLDCRRMK